MLWKEDQVEQGKGTENAEDARMAGQDSCLLRRMFIK